MSAQRLPGPRAARLFAVLLGALLSVTLGSVLAFLVGGGLNVVEVVPAARATEPACRAVAAAWPTAVGDHGRVRTSADSPTVAAWGDPAIIARCGVTSPGPTTDPCIDVSGVDWVAQTLTDGTRFVSYGRSPAVEVLVPGTYASAPLLLGAFTEATARIEPGERRCY